MNCFGFIKLKAQAMHLALLVGTVVALLLASFVLLVHFNSFFKVKAIQTNALIEGVNQYIFSELEDSKLQIADTLTTQKDRAIQKTHVSYYGCWQKLYAELDNSKNQFSKTLFVGNEVKRSSPSLYLKNSNSPLILVGRTTLKGNVFIPKQGVKAGTIAGNYFQNSQLVFGNINYSKSELPKLDKQWVSYIKSLQNNTLLQKNEINELSSDLENSFKEKTKIVYQASPISLNRGKIHGNIIIKSATSIHVSRGISLVDVILIAPRITIENNVIGTFQVIAKEKIIVGKNCKLNFPSSLVLYKKEKLEVSNSFQPSLLIGKGSNIEGSVVFLKESTKTIKKIRRGINTHLKIEEKALIHGEVYCQGNMELLGTINGSCYTERFIANQFGSKYINHIYNGKVTPFLVDSYGGLPIENRGRKRDKSIVKWLY